MGQEEGRELGWAALVGGETGWPGGRHIQTSAGTPLHAGAGRGRSEGGQQQVRRPRGESVWPRLQSSKEAGRE